MAQRVIEEISIACEESCLIETMQERDNFLVLHSHVADVITYLANSDSPSLQKPGLAKHYILVNNFHSKSISTLFRAIDNPGSMFSPESSLADQFRF